ncbi:phage tail tape measure protein [Enterococcus hulanensis]|uniref:phage tail tape measure protein n=1 Tax=Enterococcus hulanensis TaxID=2559929 RepID=UPI001A8C4BDC|nr:phage tail tape measure protein [Enterococcus hulanensis]MBO0459832.1 phage tail tape measure protein [Enterococcus hulanensis]
MAKNKTEAEIVFKATDDGLKNTVKGITAEMTKNKAELKLEQAQLQLTGSETQKLESKMGGLEKQYDLQGKKIEATSDRLENAKKYYGENSQEVAKLEKELINQQTAQQKTANEISKTEKALSEAKGETKSYASTMNDLDKEQKDIQASAALAESEYRKWQATTGKTASESEKFAKAQEYVGKQSELAEQKIDVMERQLEATRQEFGENSTEAKRMEAALNEAETEFQQLGDAAQEATEKGSLEEIGSKIDLANLQNAADRLSDIGQKIVEVGKSSLEAFDTVDEGLDTIITKTGASQDQMAGYEKIYRKLGGEMPVELAKVGEAIGEVNTQLGFQEDELEAASKQAIQFSEINGQDVTSSVVSAKQALSAYSLENKDFSMVLDTVTKVAQDTGQSTQDLFDKAVQGAPQIKQLGLSFQEGVTLMGNFEKAGVDSGAALSSLSKASVAYAKDGKTLQDGLAETIDKIKNASSETEALSVASEVFGTKGAVRMVDAIKRGTFNLEEFGKASEDTTGKVAKTFEDTLDPIDELTVAQNNLTMVMADFGAAIAEVLAPILQSISDILKNVAEKFSSLSPQMKEMIVVVGGLATGFMLLAPFVVSAIAIFSTLGGLFAGGGIMAGVGAFFTGTLIPAIPIIAAVVAAIAGVIAIVTNWGTITEWLDGVLAQFGLSTSAIWQGIQTVISTVSNAVWGVINTVWGTIQTWFSQNQELIKQTASTVWNAIKTIITVIMNYIVPFLKTSWNTVSTVVSTVWEVIKTTIYTVLNVILGTIKTIMQSINGDWSGAWETAKNTAQIIWNAIKQVIETIFGGVWNKIKEIAENIKNSLSGAWESVKTTASNMWNAIKDAITAPFSAAWDTISGIVDKIKSAFDFNISFPRIEIPDIPLPHFEMSGSFNPLKGELPSIGVNWYAKGGMFTGPNVIGVGEAGPEAVLPLRENVLGKIGSMIAKTMENDKLVNSIGTTVNNITVEWQGDIDSPERTRQLAQVIVDEMTEIQRNGFK